MVWLTSKTMPQVIAVMLILVIVPAQLLVTYNVIKPTTARLLTARTVIPRLGYKATVTVLAFTTASAIKTALPMHVIAVRSSVPSYMNLI
jgi:hypothetical protein